MVKHNNFKEFDTLSRRKFMESLGMRFYGEPAVENPAEITKAEKAVATAAARKVESNQKRRKGTK